MGKIELSFKTLLHSMVEYSKNIGANLFIAFICVVVNLLGNVIKALSTYSLLGVILTKVAIPIFARAQEISKISPLISFFSNLLRRFFFF